MDECNVLRNRRSDTAVLPSRLTCSVTKGERVPADQRGRPSCHLAILPSCQSRRALHAPVDIVRCLLCNSLALTSSYSSASVDLTDGKICLELLELTRLTIICAHLKCRCWALVKVYFLKEPKISLKRLHQCS